MLSSQQQIISFVTDHLQGKTPVWLCTIIKTWGSSPRPIGAMMACTMKGELVGSISGGCIEEDFLEQLIEKRKIQGEFFKKNFIDIGTIQDLNKAKKKYNFYFQN